MAVGAIYLVFMEYLAFDHGHRRKKNYSRVNRDLPVLTMHGVGCCVPWSSRKKFLNGRYRPCRCVVVANRSRTNLRDLRHMGVPTAVILAVTVIAISGSAQPRSWKRYERMKDNGLPWLVSCRFDRCCRRREKNYCVRKLRCWPARFLSANFFATICGHPSVE